MYISICYHILSTRIIFFQSSFNIILQDINYHSFSLFLKASLFFFSNGNYLNRVYNFGLYDFFLFSFHYFQITTPLCGLTCFLKRRILYYFAFVYFMNLISLWIFSLWLFIYSLWYYLDTFFISLNILDLALCFFSWFFLIT